MVKIVTGLSRHDIGVTHKHTVWLCQRFEVAAEIKHRIGIALDADRLVGVLLRLEQIARRRRLAELLHKLAHNHGQLLRDFIPELRVAFFRGNLLGKVQNNPATGNTAAAVGKAHRVIVHRQNHRRDMRRVGVAVFRVDRDRIAAGDRFNSRTVTASFLLVRENNQRVANHRRTFAG